MRKVFVFFKRFFTAIRYRFAEIQLNYAIYQAEKAHAISGDRYYVIPDSNRKLTILNRREFRALRRYDLIDDTKRIKDIMKTSFYFTADRGGNQVLRPVDMQAKKEVFFKWYFRAK